MAPASTASALEALRVLKREPERVSNLREISNYVRIKVQINFIYYILLN